MTEQMTKTLKTIEIEPAKPAVTVMVSEDEVRRVVKVLGARGFSICLNLDAALDSCCHEIAGAISKDDVLNTVVCPETIVDWVLR